MGLYEDIGLRIRLWREEAGLTQEELGQRVRLTRTSITNIEAGGQKVQVDVLYAIAQALNVSLDRFLPPEEKGLVLIDAQILKGVPSNVREWLKAVLISNWTGGVLPILEGFKRDTAEGSREEIIKRAGIKEPPVDIEKIASLQGVEVRYSPFKSEGQLTGCLFQTPDEAYIAINSSQDRTRQRFTIAHLLGYLFLHGSIEFHLDLDFPVNEIRDEQRANEIALELLIPKTFIERDLKNKIVDFENSELIKDLAERYKVSSQIMTLRIFPEIFRY